MSRHKIGRITDQSIREIVMKNPGLSLYEISKLCGSSIGLVDGSIRRLEKSGSVLVQHSLRGGRSVTEIFPSSYLENYYKLSQVSLERSAFSDPDKWKDVAYLYALSRSSIGISPAVEPEWESKAVLHEEVKIQKDERRNIIVKIPSKFREFYLWENSKVDLTVADELVLLNIVTEIPIVQSKESAHEIGFEPSKRKLQWK